jgi:hypothetical protein
MTKIERKFVQEGEDISSGPVVTVWHFVPELEFLSFVLRPGDSITFSGGGQHEEGYCYWSDTISHEGEYITLSEGSTGSDCDGRIDQGSSAHCRVDKVAAIQTCPEDQFTPDWKCLEQSQRDHTAESMGY